MKVPRVQDRRLRRILPDFGHFSSEMTILTTGTDAGLPIGWPGTRRLDIANY
jgi:hypothetical protein